ncbi:MAG: flagellar basal-body rod protein FlgB [Pseudomonadota bacterium]
MLNDIQIFGTLANKMNWHQARQTVLAENVANADTPDFDARELQSFTPETPVQLASLGTVRTNAAHFAGEVAGASEFAMSNRERGWEVTPEGNGVVLEEQMMKLTENQMDYEVATALYSRALGLIRTSVAR